MSDEAREAAWVAYKSGWDIQLVRSLEFQARHDFFSGWYSAVGQARDVVCAALKELTDDEDNSPAFVALQAIDALGSPDD